MSSRKSVKSEDYLEKLYDGDGCLLVRSQIRGACGVRHMPPCSESGGYSNETELSMVGPEAVYPFGKYLVVATN